MKFLWFIGMFAGGLLLVKYFKWIVDHTRRYPSIEKFLGPGGTYTFWKLLGIVLMLGSFYVLTH